jgi:hypothetical protein
LPPSRAPSQPPMAHGNDPVPAVPTSHCSHSEAARSFAPAPAQALAPASALAAASAAISAAAHASAVAGSTEVARALAPAPSAPSAPSASRPASRNPSRRSTPRAPSSRRSSAGSTISLTGSSYDDDDGPDGRTAAWYCAPDGQTQIGPVYATELREMELKGGLRETSLFWREGQEEGWLPLSRLPELRGRMDAADGLRQSIDAGVAVKLARPPAPASAPPPPPTPPARACVPAPASALAAAPAAISAAAHASAVAGSTEVARALAPALSAPSAPSASRPASRNPSRRSTPRAPSSRRSSARSSASLLTDDDEDGPDGPVWYCRRGGRNPPFKIGPVDPVQLQELRARGGLRETSLFWREGQEQGYLPLSQLPELRDRMDAAKVMLHTIEEQEAAGADRQ